MNTFVSITDFRNNIFNYSDFIAKNNEVYVEKNNQAIFKVVPVSNESIINAIKMYKLVKSRKRVLTQTESKKLDKTVKSFRNKKEIEYFSNL